MIELKETKAIRGPVVRDPEGSSDPEREAHRPEWETEETKAFFGFPVSHRITNRHSQYNNTRFTILSSGTAY